MLGSGEGIVVGKSMGEEVGMWEGAVDKKMLGWRDGSKDGCEDGEFVGMHVGVLVGVSAELDVGN